MTAFDLLPRLLPDGAFSCPYPSWFNSESICSRSLRSNSIACCLSWATCSSAVIFDPLCCVAGKRGLFFDKLNAIVLFDSVVVQAAHRRNLEDFSILKSRPVYIRVRFSELGLAVAILVRNKQESLLLERIDIDAQEYAIHLSFSG